MTRPIRTIAVGVATVDELDPVLPSAIRLAQSTRARLHVVHVYDPPEPMLLAEGGAAGVDLGALYCARRNENIATALEEQCSRFAEMEGVEVHALMGSAHRELSQLAARVGADVLVIGSTRRGRIWRSVLGTTAERVLRASTVPVLVLHQPFFHPVERVLLTTDLSELSAGVHERALDVVEGLFGADRFECRSLLVLGYTPPLPPPLRADSAEEIGRLVVGKFLAERSPRGYPVAGRVRVGQPSEEINVEAAAWGADLIVLGTHGRSGLARYAFGSVAAATLRDGSRNVLVIPAASEASPTTPEPGRPVDPEGAATAPVVAG